MRILKSKIIIIFILILIKLNSFGQRKQIDYIKTVKHSSVDNTNKDARSYVSKINIQKHKESEYYLKEINFDTNEVKYFYKITYSDYIGFEYFSFSWHKDFKLNIGHSFEDTLINKRYSINYLLNFSGEQDSCSLIINQFNNNYLEIQLNAEEVKKYYMEWIEKNYEKLDSFDRVPFPDITQFKKLKSRHNYIVNQNTENYKICESYYVDSIFLDGNLINIDTILKEKSKIYCKTENGISEYYKDYQIGTKHTFEGYIYDSIEHKTKQFIYETISENDTVYRISIDTKIEMNTMVSDYKIIGNYPYERYFYSGLYYPREFIFKERTIRIIRDSTGYKIRGEANGITKEDVKVKCTFYTINPSKNYTQYRLKENVTPNRLSENIKSVNGKTNQNYYFEYSIISMFPNIDLKPLMEINYVTNKRTVVKSLNYYLIPNKYPKGMKYKSHQKRMDNIYKIPEYKYETKRIEKNKKMNFEIWKREESGGKEFTIYEVYFK
jgi:hypothetical protein